MATLLPASLPASHPPSLKIDNNQAKTNHFEKNLYMLPGMVQDVLSNISKAQLQALTSFPLMVQGAMSNDFKAQLKATTFFRKLLSIEKKEMMLSRNHEVIHSGVVPRFVEFMKQSHRPALQFAHAPALLPPAAAANMPAAHSTQPSEDAPSDDDHRPGLHADW